MQEQPLSADSIHRFDGDAIAALGPVNHVRLNIHPDGGVSRFRVFEKPSL
jgi:allantoicase